jgi:hypothetical protein
MLLMTRTVILSLFTAFFALQGISQGEYLWKDPVPKTLLLWKLGTNKKYAYKVEDKIKLVTVNRELMYNFIWEISDTMISLEQKKPLAVKDIILVYPQFYFPKKFGRYMFIAGVAYFTVVSINHLINNEPVFTRDVFIVPTVLFGAGLVSISLSQKRCRIGDHWKLKVLEIKIL